MSHDDDKTKTVAITDWWLFQRVHEVESASRINLLRFVGLILFYGVHLAAYANRDSNDAAFERYHSLVTKIGCAWLIVAIAVAVALKLRTFPPLSKFVTTIIDIALLTGIALAGEKAMSGVVMIYLLIIATSFLRFSVPLVVTTTVASVVGYYVLVGATDPVWFDADHVVPIDQQGVTVMAMLLTGVVGWFLCTMSKNWFETQESLRRERVPEGP